MTNLINTYRKSNDYLKRYNKVKQVGFCATVKYMLGCCSIVGGHGFGF